MAELSDEIELWAYCTSDDGHEISFGTTVDNNELPLRDDFWIVDGIYEYINENWQEFEEVAEQTKSICLNWYQSNCIVPESEKEVDLKVKEKLRDLMGNFMVKYKMNGETIKNPCEYSNEEISEVVYRATCSIFAISFNVLRDLRNS